MEQRMGKRVVIVGGGFAGSIIAKSLQDKFEVVLIDTKEYFEFTPGILKIVRDRREAGRVRVKHLDYLGNGKLVVGKVDRIGKDFVVVAGEERIYFDVLVLATGAHYNSIAGSEKGVFSAYHSWEIEKSLKELERAKSVAVIGGGLVGVELSAELAESFNGKIKLIQSHNSLIPRNELKSSKLAEEFLKNNGVEIVYNCRITKRKDGKIVSEDGKEFEGDVVFIATGLVPASEFINNGALNNCLDKRGHIVVDKCLKVVFGGKKLDNVFAVGDVNSISEEKTAQNAERQAKLVVGNIRALFKGRGAVEYKQMKTPLVISLGRWNGIFESKGFIFSGVVPALLKWAVEKREIWRRRYFND